MNKKGTLQTTLTRLLLSLLVLIVIASPGQTAVQAGVPAGTIAYVRYDPADGDEIHLIEPDGSGDRVIFATGQPLSEYLTDIKQLDWKPDASELAFSSSHEAGCSLFETDIYTIRPDGRKYRRISGPPACGAAAGLPTGTVIVPVENASSESGVFTIYFEGAPGPIEVALFPGSAVDVTFYNVADYGDEEQWAIWMYGKYRNYYPGAIVDVKPGATVETGPLEIHTGLTNYGYSYPNYLPDGSAIGALFQETALFTLPSNNADFGFAGTKDSLNMTMAAKNLAWGPTPGLENIVLFHGWTTDDSYAGKNPIMMADVRDQAGSMLVDVDPTRLGKWVLGITWLPDGSGFLYSLSELVGYDDRANIWEYSFATGQSKRVTNVPYGFAREITVSPDGQTILFELQPSGHWYDVNPAIDLWMVNRDGSGMGVFLEDARSPAWSSQAIPEIVEHNVFLPFTIR